MSDRFLFAVAPLVAAATLAVTTAFRLMKARQRDVRPLLPFVRGQGGFMRALPSIGLLGVLIGHVLMIVWPEQLLLWNRDLPRLIVFEITLIALGAAGLAGIAGSVPRRIFRVTPGGITDAALLGVLLLTLASGLGVGFVYRWAAAWSVLTVTPYVRSLVTLRPDVGSIETMPYLVKLHIFSSFVVVAMLARTRLFDATVLPLFRATQAFAFPFASGIDRGWHLVVDRAIRLGRRLIWPEGEE